MINVNYIVADKVLINFSQIEFQTTGVNDMTITKNFIVKTALLLTVSVLCCPQAWGSASNSSASGVSSSSGTSTSDSAGSNSTNYPGGGSNLYFSSSRHTVRLKVKISETSAYDYILVVDGTTHDIDDDCLTGNGTCSALTFSTNCGYGSWARIQNNAHVQMQINNSGCNDSTDSGIILLSAAEIIEDKRTTTTIPLTTTGTTTYTTTPQTIPNTTTNTTMTPLWTTTETTVDTATTTLLTTNTTIPQTTVDTATPTLLTTNTTAPQTTVDTAPTTLETTIPTTTSSETTNMTTDTPETTTIDIGIECNYFCNEYADDFNW